MKNTLSVIAFLVVQTVAFAQPIKGTDVYLCEDADVKPHFAGGDSTFTRFLDSLATQMPRGCDNVSSISFSFLVEKDGRISEAGAEPLTEPVCADFIVKHILAMHKWSPAMKNGKPIRVLCGGEIRFREDDKHELIELGSVIIEDGDSPPPPPPPPGEIDYGTPNNWLAYKPTDSSEVYSYGDPIPQFPGGNYAMIEYIVNNMKYPKSDTRGSVFVNFVVEKDGSLSNLKVVESIDGPDSALFDAEALRIVSTMPKWEPGKYKGQTVRMEYNLPIRFR